MRHKMRQNERIGFLSRKMDVQRQEVKTKTEKNKPTPNHREWNVRWDKIQRKDVHVNLSRGARMGN